MERKRWISFMSMKSTFIYGYGFYCDCDNEKLIDFVKKHKKTFCKSEGETKLYENLLKFVGNEYDMEDFFARYSCDTNSMEGNGAVIANIMSRETGIRFLYCLPDDACDTAASIVFEVSYPWQLNEVEKYLTEEKLSNICKQYIEELGIKEIPNYLELEYYG